MTFTPMGSKATDNWLWDFYNKSKVKVNVNKDSTLSPHYIKVAEAFSIFS